MSLLGSLLILGSLASAAWGQQCDVAGQCQGTLLGFSSIATKAECLVLCKVSKIEDFRNKHCMIRIYSGESRVLVVHPQ